MVTIGQRVKIIRLIRGLDQATLAVRTGLGRNTISAFERDRYNSQRGTRRKIEAAFGLELTDPDVEAAFSILADDAAKYEAVVKALAFLEQSNGQ